MNFTISIHSLAFLILISMISFSCKSTHGVLPVVENVDLEKYQGTWYEIMRLPNSFEKGLDCVSATYTLRDNGKISVLNQGRKRETNQFKKINGVAKLASKNEPGKLKVQFFWPFYGKYWIIELDKNYKYVLVGSPSRRYLWILAREKSLDETIIRELLEKAKNLGFPADKLIMVNQQCNTPST